MLLERNGKFTMWKSKSLLTSLHKARSSCVELLALSTPFLHKSAELPFELKLLPQCFIALSNFIISLLTVKLSPLHLLLIFNNSHCSAEKFERFSNCIGQQFYH